MSRVGIFGALVAIGMSASMLLKPEPPEMSNASAPQITAAVNHEGGATTTQVRWGRFFGGYSPYYYGGAYGYNYYSPYWGGSYYAARPYYYGSPYYYSWWW